MERKVKFTVAMDAEQKKAGNTEDVELIVEIPEDDEGVMNAVFNDAMKTYVISLQSQIRSHWDTFLDKGVPERLTFGDVLYSTPRKKVVVRRPTVEEMKDYAAQQISLLNSEGIQIFIQTGKFPEDEKYYKSK